MLDNSKGGRLRHAGSNMLWETTTVTAFKGWNDTVTVSSWCPNGVAPRDYRGNEHDNSIFYRDFILLERLGSNSIYTHGWVRHDSPDDDYDPMEYDKATDDQAFVKAFKHIHAGMSLRLNPARAPNRRSSQHLNSKNIHRDVQALHAQLKSRSDPIFHILLS